MSRRSNGKENDKPSIGRLLGILNKWAGPEKCRSRKGGKRSILVGWMSVRGKRSETMRSCRCYHLQEGQDEENPARTRREGTDPSLD